MKKFFERTWVARCYCSGMCGLLYSADFHRAAAHLDWRNPWVCIFTLVLAFVSDPGAADVQEKAAQSKFTGKPYNC